MKKKPKYSIEFSVLLLSILILVYICFLMYAHHSKLNSALLNDIFKFTTIPALLGSLIIPVWTAYRFNTKKIKYKSLAIAAFCVSIVSIVTILTATYYY